MKRATRMKLRILLPTEVFLEQEVIQIVAEAKNGSFCLLPRHSDFVSALSPGLLSFKAVNGRENFVAVNRGLLVKCGSEVLVSTARAVQGANLGALRQAVKDEFEVLDDKAKQARAALHKLEAGFVRRFLELTEHGL